MERAFAIQFGGYEYRRQEKLLAFDGQPVALGSRARALLERLLETPGDYVGVAELMAVAWPKTFVDESNLRVQIASIRRAIAKADKVSLLNAPGHGYALVGDIRGAEEETARSISITIEIRAGDRRISERLSTAVSAAVARVVTAPELLHNDVSDGDGML